MKYRIYFSHGNYVDSIVVVGDTLEEVQKKAAIEIDSRNPDDYWSVEEAP